MNYLKGGRGTSRKHDEAMEIGRPLTPKSERPNKTLGVLTVSLQTADGLCKENRKCVKREGHSTECWPA